MDGERADPVPAEPPRLRAGHDDRAAAMKALDDHFEAGRLDVTEYSERSATAGSATYRDELSVLFTDLPDVATEVHPAAPRLPARMAHHLAVLVPILLAIGLVVLTITTDHAGAFMFFPLIFLLTGGFGHRRF